MEYNTQTGNLTCAFNFMQLRRIKRNSDKKASEVRLEDYLINARCFYYASTIEKNHRYGVMGDQASFSSLSTFITGLSILCEY